MFPTLTTEAKRASNITEKKASVTHLLHRTPWTPPIAVSAEGIYIDLADGKRVIDGVGGAAVTCLGGNHPVVKAALKEQIDKMSCKPYGILMITYIHGEQMYTVCSCPMVPQKN